MSCIFISGAECRHGHYERFAELDLVVRVCNQLAIFGRLLVAPKGDVWALKCLQWPDD